MIYSPEAIERSRDDALRWLAGDEWDEGNIDGYPCSWAQEEADEEFYSRPIYTADWCAPPIAGYEALEAEGLVTRMETVDNGDGMERIHFRLKATSDSKTPATA